MTDPAQAAVDNAFRLEAKKDALRQIQDGLWKVTFTVQASDMPSGLLMAAMGTRFMLAACEIADDEQPVVQPEAAQATPAEVQSDTANDTSEPESTIQPAERRQMTAANVAGMLTHDVRFQTFLHDQFSATWHAHRDRIEDNAKLANIVLKKLTGVESKTQFDRPDSEGARRWQAMHADYDVWCRS